jgi:hypothetical protein
VRRNWLVLFLMTGACGGGDDGPSGDPPDAPWPAPVVEITSHADGDRVLGARTVTITGTLDSWAAIDAVTVTVDGGDPIDATHDDASFSVEVELGDDANAVVVTATSAAGEGGDAVELDYPFVALESFAPALRVIGHADFVTAELPAELPTAVALPYGKVAWDGETLFVPGSEHNRVLGFAGIPAADGAAATRALGQPDLETTTPGTGAGGLDFPQSVMAHGGRIYVLDYGGNRILGWDAAPASSGVAADFVVGQVDLDTNQSGCTRERFAFPDDFFVGAGKMIVSDRENDRVLVYDTAPTADGALPDLVLGQADFTHCVANDDDQDGAEDPDPSARTLSAPVGAWTDGTRLYVVDQDNHRVLVWTTFPTSSFEPADLVLGQIDFTESSPRSDADGLNRPISVSSNGNPLAIADPGNHRVLIWNALPTESTAPADVVLGQSDFQHVAENDDDQDGVADALPTARTLAGVSGVEFVLDTLALSDIGNNRILFHGTLPQ